jgi:hypothetical protein
VNLFGVSDCRLKPRGEGRGQITSNGGRLLIATELGQIRKHFCVIPGLAFSRELLGKQFGFLPTVLVHIGSL